jgi:GNAT superfamily N-acetyltransferase
MTALTTAASVHHEAAPRQALLIRPLRRDDGDLLDEVMAGMSSRSRYQRFHSPKKRLTPADRAHLTNVDGRDHLAVAGLAPHGAPLGVARAIRLRDDPAVAEVAVAIVDASQGNAIGTKLVASLARRAAAAGIERLVAHVLAETGLAQSLTRRGWHVIAREGHTLTLEVAAWQVAGRR